jgi:pyruvate/2-oxoglutarate dehydrogenase complex dihydrolipoamide acyltransferase (E2) component
MAKNSVRRKLAIATWNRPMEGNIYGKMVVDAQPALDYIAKKREDNGIKVTITHIVGAAVARALAQAPGLNGKILFGKYYPHKMVDIAFLVSLEDGKNLAKSKIDDADKKPVTTIATELREKVELLRTGKDEAFKKSMGPIKLLPTWLIRPILRVTGWLTASLGIQAKMFGLERYPFGSAVVTSVGMFGLDEGFAPPTPFARCPVFVLVGAVRDAAAVVNGTIVARKEMTVTATIDHRFMDGAQGGTLARVMREVMADPYQLDAPPKD